MITLNLSGPRGVDSQYGAARPTQQKSAGPQGESVLSEVITIEVPGSALVICGSSQLPWVASVEHDVFVAASEE
jgi:hypothetical protein